MPHFEYEKKAKSPVVGLDEVGCGPWAGPIVAAAAFLKPDCLPAALLEILTDSKQLSPKKRALVYDILEKEQEHSCLTAWGLASVQEIDQINIREAAKLAMMRALEKLSISPQHILVDGTIKLPLEISQTAIIKGDQQSFSIAAASVVAKVTRDRMMVMLSESFPAYGWHKNMGYGTAEHRWALDHYGPTAHHRQSYKPVQEACRLKSGQATAIS